MDVLPELDKLRHGPELQELAAVHLLPEQPARASAREPSPASAALAHLEAAEPPPAAVHLPPEPPAELEAAEVPAAVDVLPELDPLRALDARRR